MKCDSVFSTPKSSYHISLTTILRYAELLYTDSKWLIFTYLQYTTRVSKLLAWSCKNHHYLKNRWIPLIKQPTRQSKAKLQHRNGYYSFVTSNVRGWPFMNGAEWNLRNWMSAIFLELIKFQWDFYVEYEGNHNRLQPSIAVVLAIIVDWKYLCRLSFFTRSARPRPRVFITVRLHEHRGVSNHRQLDLYNSWFKVATSKIKTPHCWPFVDGIHRWPVVSPYKGSILRRAFHCHDVIMHVGISQHGSARDLGGLPFLVTFDPLPNMA